MLDREEGIILSSEVRIAFARALDPVWLAAAILGAICTQRHAPRSVEGDMTCDTLVLWGSACWGVP